LARAGPGPDPGRGGEDGRGQPAAAAAGAGEHRGRRGARAAVFRPILPDLKATGLAGLATGNRTSRPTRPLAPELVAITPTSWHLYNSYDFTVDLNQTIWDFGQTWHRWRAAQARSAAQGQTEAQTRLTIVRSVRTAYFAAWAQKAMVAVARDALANQQRHLAQITGFVDVGSRPQDRRRPGARRSSERQGPAHPRRGQLRERQGGAQPRHRRHGTARLRRVRRRVPRRRGEDGPSDALVVQALGARPDLRSLRYQTEAQQLTLKAIKGAYLPRSGSARRRATGAPTSATCAGTSAGGSR
jgi:outer membrane protein